MKCVLTRHMPLLLLMILLVGTGLRLYALGDKELWHDEIQSVAFMQKEINFRNFFEFLSYKPIYFFILRGWMACFPLNEFNVRLLSVIFGIVAIFFTFKLGKLLFDESVGIISAFFLAISCFHIYHCQQARHITLIVLLVIISYFFLFKFTEERTSKHLIGNLLGNILILFTHPFGMVFILAQYVFVMVYAKMCTKDRMQWACYQLFLIVSLLLWFTLANRTRVDTNIWWFPQSSFALLKETLDTFSFGGSSYGLHVISVPIGFLSLPYALSYIYGICFIISLFVFYKKCRTVSEDSLSFCQAYLMLLCWLFISITMVYIVSYVKNLYVIKHLMPAVVPFYILVALGVTSVLKRYRIACFFLLGVISILSMLPVRYLYAHDHHFGWKETAQFLKKRLVRDDTIAVSLLQEIPSLVFYLSDTKEDCLKEMDIYGKYENGRFSDLFMKDGYWFIGVPHHRNDTSINYIMQRFKTQLRKRGNLTRSGVWLVMSDWTSPDLKKRLIYQLHSATYRVIQQRKFRGIQIFKCIR